jgi:methylenetetrahydrofolate--tRNA-(uracil-5-)-methyltransferase
MNINFGLFPPIEAPGLEGKRLRGKEKTLAKRHAVTARALHDCGSWLGLSEPARAAE